MEQLRALVVGPEERRIQALEQRPPSSPETIGQVLPEALAHATGRRERELGIAIEPPVTGAVRSLARREPDFFGELLAPTIGAAVRKAVRDAMTVILQRIDQVLEQSLTIQGLRWRVEAKRRKLPLAEVVLRHTMIYRVEQVFLIHVGTGIVLHHVSNEGAGLEQPDQVAAMLEAIDSFVREAFRPQPTGVHLDQLRVGDLTVWVDRDARLALAAVIRGSAPHVFGDVLREVRERISLAHQVELASFRSDVSPFAAAGPELEECLKTERRKPARKAGTWLMALAVVLLAVTGALLVRHDAKAEARARELDTVVETLRQEPGLLVTSAGRRSGHIRIAGLRDPLARPPEAVLAARGITADVQAFEPFYSLDPRMVVARVKRALDPPTGVTISIEDGTLRAGGVAPRDWISMTKLRAPALLGVDRLDAGGLRAAEALDELGRSAGSLGTFRLPFAQGSAIVAREPARLARAQLAWLGSAADEARIPVCIEVMGHADPSGPQDLNQELSELRARNAVEALRGPSQAGSTFARLRAVGQGVWHGAPTPGQARSVTFHVAVGQSCPEDER
jgi:hypothetical protein